MQKKKWIYTLYGKEMGISIYRNVAGAGCGYTSQIDCYIESIGNLKLFIIKASKSIFNKFVVTIHDQCHLL